MKEITPGSLSGAELINLFDFPYHSLGPGDGFMNYPTAMDKYLLSTYMLTRLKNSEATPKNVRKIMQYACIGASKNSEEETSHMLVVHWYFYQYFWSHLHLVEVFTVYPEQIKLLSTPICTGLFWIPSVYEKVSLRRQSAAMERSMREGYIPIKHDWDDPDYERIAKKTGLDTSPYLAWWRNSKYVGNEDPIKFNP